MSTESADSLKLQITYSLDRLEYFRRTCPKCGLDFKTKANPSEIASIIQPIIKKAAIEISEELTDDLNSKKPDSKLTCPYCGQIDDTSNFLTAEFQRYIERLAMREYVLPKLHDMLSSFTDDFPNTSHRSGGLISFSISVNYERDLLPPRLISGPEPPDMKILDLLCCDKTIKVVEKWIYSANCPYCGIMVVLR